MMSTFGFQGEVVDEGGSEVHSSKSNSSLDMS